ncbi:tape measure protein [Limosilactobacillus pontis]|uniref:tape measure protein n=1 Tax=Limosilactobacillus pontis TaxID=35787 RepID=UPI002F2682C5
MATVQAKMATEVALDLVQASTAIKNLTSAVSASTSAWRSQEAYLRSVGDYAGATRAKYDGLGEAMDAQRRKIEALQEKQRSMTSMSSESASKFLSLKKQIDATREAMGQLDTSTGAAKAAQKSMQSTLDGLVAEQKKLNVGTTDSARQYLNFGRQIDQAKAKLANMEAQQQRAAQQMDIEDSGVRRLSASMRAQQGLVSATVERLRSQGQAYQALETDLNGTRQRLSGLQQIQQKEIGLLDQTKQRFGENSEQYAKQATRVQELGTQINETSAKVSELNEQMRRTPSGWLGNVQERLNRIQGGADRVSTSFGRIFGATAAANMFTGALASIQGQLGGLVRAGTEYDITQNKMNATWTTLTGSASKAGPMIDSINKMSQATGQNVDVVNELEQGFYHLNSSKHQADTMTSSLLNMADAVGLNGDQIQAVEQDMVHGMATGKITQGELNQIGQYFPMIDEAMAKHFHTSVAGMRQMAEAGKITSKDLQDVFASLGNGKYKEAADNMMNSYFGVFRTIRARTPQLVGDITKPFMSISNPFLQSVRNWVNDKSTDTEFRRLGNQMARSMNQIISAFGGSNISATKLMDNAIRGLTNGVSRFGDIVASHHTQIANFFKAFKTGSVAQAKLFAAVFTDLSKVMLPVLDTMARFPKTSAALVTSFLLASRAMRTLQAGIKGLETLKATGELIRTFGNRVRNIPTRKTTRIEVNGAQSTRELQAYSNRLDRLPKAKTTTVSANTAQANRNVGAYERQAQRVPRRIATTATANTTAATTSIGRVGSTAKAASLTSRLSFASIGAAAKTAGTTISLAFRANPFGMILTGIQLAVAGFQLLYQHSAKFRRFANGIANATKSLAGKVGRWFGNMASSAGKHISRMAQSAKRGWNNMNRTSQRSSQRETRIQSQMARRNQQSSQQMWARLRRSWLQGWRQNTRVTQQSTRREIQQHRRMSMQINRLHSRLWTGLVRFATRGWNNNNRLTRKSVQQQVQQHRMMSTRIAVFNNQMWRRSGQAFLKGWGGLLKSTQTGARNVNNEFNRMRVSVGQRTQQAMNDAGQRFRKGYRDVTNDTSGWRGDMQNIWNDTRGKIGDVSDKLRSDSTGKFADMHSKLNGLTNNGLGQMLGAWHDKLEGIAGVVTSSGGHIHARFLDLLHDLAKPFEGLINGIKDGVNWILDHVGGDGKLGGFTFNAFATGSDGPIDKDQIALLNDAPGSNYQEMVHRKSSGETFMLPAKRNMLFPLQQGDEVLDGERAHRLTTMMQMPIPHAGGAVGSFFSGIFDKVGDAVDDATDWVDKALKNVVEFGTEMFSHFVAKVSPKSTDSINNGLKLGLPGFYAHHLQAWLKKQLEAADADAQGYVSKEKFAQIARHAASLMHQTLSAGDIDHLYWQGHVESGDGANMGAGVDDHDGTGRPLGFYQYKRSTWNSWAVAGHNKIMSILDQTMAVLNDSNWRSDLAPIGTKRGWGPTGHKLFANGGIATVPSIFGEAGAEMAIPLDTMKSTRAWQLMKQVVDYYAGNATSGNNQPASQTDLTPLEKRFDAALAQNQQLINLIDKLIGVTDAANNPTARYRRTQRDVNMANYQSFT